MIAIAVAGVVRGLTRVILRTCPNYISHICFLAFFVHKYSFGSCSVDRCLGNRRRFGSLKLNTSCMS